MSVDFARVDISNDDIVSTWVRSGCVGGTQSRVVSGGVVGQQSEARARFAIRRPITTIPYDVDDGKSDLGTWATWI